MSVEYRLMPDEPLILIYHRGRPSEKSEDERRADRRAAHDYLASRPERCTVIVDFSEATWSFAEQVIGLGSMLTHFRDLGGIEFLHEHMELIIVGESETAEMIAGAIRQDQYGSFRSRIAPSMDEAIAMTRARKEPT